MGGLLVGGLSGEDLYSWEGREGRGMAICRRRPGALVATASFT